jgi:hypothetical protein
MSYEGDVADSIQSGWLIPNRMRRSSWRWFATRRRPIRCFEHVDILIIPYGCPIGHCGIPLPPAWRSCYISPVQHSGLLGRWLRQAAEREKVHQTRVQLKRVKYSWGREWVPLWPLGAAIYRRGGGGNLAPAPWWVQYLQIGPRAATFGPFTTWAGPFSQQSI